MAKGSGLGAAFYVHGYDLSGDVSAVTRIGAPSALLDVTAINKSAHERIYGLYDGEISWATWFNDAASQEHAVLKAKGSGADRVVTYFQGSTLGNMAAGMVAKLNTYDWTRGADGSFAGTVQALANGYGLDYCHMFTAGQKTDSSAADGTGVYGGTHAAAVSIDSVGEADPAPVNATGHGLVTGDSVIIAGVTTTPDINGHWTVTRVTDDQFTIDIEVTGGQVGAAGTVTRTSSRLGLAGYAQVFSLGSGSPTVKYQHSADDGVNDAYADITGATFGVVAANVGYRFCTSLTLTIEGYVRAISSGTFTDLVFATCATRFPVAA